MNFSKTSTWQTGQGTREKYERWADRCDLDMPTCNV